jgi:hypothetical protein
MVLESDDRRFPPVTATPGVSALSTAVVCTDDHLVTYGGVKHRTGKPALMWPKPDGRRPRVADLDTLVRCGSGQPVGSWNGRYGA